MQWWQKSSWSMSYPRSRSLFFMYSIDTSSSFCKSEKRFWLVLVSERTLSSALTRGFTCLLAMSRLISLKFSSSAAVTHTSSKCIDLSNETKYCVASETDSFFFSFVWIWTCYNALTSLMPFTRTIDSASYVISSLRAVCAKYWVRTSLLWLDRSCLEWLAGYSSALTSRILSVKICALVSICLWVMTLVFSSHSRFLSISVIFASVLLYYCYSA